MAEFQELNERQTEKPGNMETRSRLLDPIEKPLAANAVQNFLDKQADDPRRSLTKEDRSALKQLSRAVLSGDVKKLEAVMNGLSDKPGRGEYIGRAFETDMQRYGGVFVRSVGGELSISDFKVNASIYINNKGEPTKATIQGDTASQEKVLKTINATIKGNIEKNLRGENQSDLDDAAFFDRWHKLHQKVAKEEAKKHFISSDGRLDITDKGDGTCTGRDEDLSIIEGDAFVLKGTVEKLPNGNTKYSLERGNTVIHGEDGTSVTIREPQDKKTDELGLHQNRSITIAYKSGLVIQEEGKRRGTWLPSGLSIAENGSGEATLGDQYTSRGKVTVQADGTREYFINDGTTIITIKPTGEVIEQNTGAYKETKAWTPDGSAVYRSSERTVLQDSLVPKGEIATYTSPTNTKLEISDNNKISLTNENGKRTLDSNRNLTWVKPNGTSVTYSLFDAKQKSWGGGWDNEYRYPDGTAVTFFRDGNRIYISVPTEGLGKDLPRQHIYYAPQNSRVWYSESGADHVNPNYFPDRHFRDNR